MQQNRQWARLVLPARIREAQALLALDQEAQVPRGLIPGVHPQLDLIQEALVQLDRTQEAPVQLDPIPEVQAPPAQTHAVLVLPR